MTRDDILTLTGASRRTFYRWRAERGFPHAIRPGEYDEAAVRGWWASHEDSVGRWPRRNSDPNADKGSTARLTL